MKPPIAHPILDIVIFNLLKLKIGLAFKLMFVNTKSYFTLAVCINEEQVEVQIFFGILFALSLPTALGIAAASFLNFY